MNAGDIKGKLATANGRADRLAKSDKPIADRVSELYQVAFGRNPTDSESQNAMEYLVGPTTDSNGLTVAQPATADRFQDLIWALINTKEFLFNH